LPPILADKPSAMRIIAPIDVVEFTTRPGFLSDHGSKAQRLILFPEKLFPMPFLHCRSGIFSNHRQNCMLPVIKLPAATEQLSEGNIC